MNRRDQELLDKQLWGMSPAPPPRYGGTLGLAIVVAFFGGLAVGGMLFAQKSNQPQTATHDAMLTLSLMNSAPVDMR